MSSLKNYFLTLNLFTSEFDKTEDETIEQRRWNIIGTRIYILLLVIILIGIAIGLSLVNHTIKVIIENPTKEQIDQLPIDAKCKCSQILIPYGTFTSVQVTFHEICSSDFITDRWINAINSGYNTTFFNGRDFRTYGSAEFQSLAGFCRLSKSYINQNIDSFYSNTLLSSEVLSEKILQSQTSSSIKQFQLISSNTFQNQLNLINNMIVGNGLNSALGTVYYYQIQLDDLDRFIVLFISITTTQEDGSTCSCLTDICNKTVSGIYNVFQAPLPTHSGDLLFRIPGISSGCLPVTSILASTLECFYDQICIDQLLSYFPTNDKNFQSLLINNQSIFNSKSTIQSIVNNLMIKNLTINISYEKYYSQCTPSSCIYFQNSHYDFKFIIKKLISLFASLILILELIIPFSIKFIQQLKDRTPKPKISLLIRLCQMKTLIKTKLIELNLFKHYPSSDRQIRYQRYATRYHLISMIILVFILTFYTLTIKTIQSKTIQKPTEFEFIQFEKEYSQTLSCPCSSISMLYSDFLTISPQYHQICSSDFISDKWFNYLYGSMTGRYYAYNRDYRFSALFQFKLLKILCKQSHSMINDALQLFFQRKFFSLQAMSQESFQIQIESVFQDWELTTIKTFLTTIQLFQAIIQGNQLTNIFNFGLDIELNSFLKMYPSIYSNCSCTYSPTCHELASIYKYDENNQEQIQIYTIPNFYTGCYQITSLLLSTLECFYDLSCLLQIDRYINSTISFQFSALNSNINSPYEKIDNLVDRLMIDEWLLNISFTSYYYICSPLSCTYQYQGRNNIFVIITSILGIFGGLLLGLKLLMVIILQFIDKILQNGIHSHILLRLIQNIFNCSTEHQIIHRLHFLFVIITLTILYYFSAFTPSIETIQINKPTLLSYEQLFNKSFDSFHCTCSQISIKYNRFFNIKPRFHSICTSDFISDKWIYYLYGHLDSIYRYDNNDYLFSATNQFRILSSFCHLSHQTVENALLQLGSSDFINTALLSFNLLNKYLEKTMIDFEQTMPQLFINTLSLIRETIGANMIINNLLTNWKYVLYFYSDYYAQTVRAVPRTYNNCHCELSSKCVSSSRGMLAGCYPLEVLLQASIQCLYNQTCIDSSNSFQAINQSSLLSSRFSLNSTFESIINKLMIEEFLTEISYETYFNACAPSLCTYSYTHKYNLIEGITTLINLYGGLFIICRILSIIIVKNILCFKQRIHPETN